MHVRHSKRMRALHLSLALFLLLCSPVRAQWWNFLWANPRTTTSSTSLSITSPSIRSMGTSDNPGTTEWMVTEDRVTEKALEVSTQIEGSLLTPTPSPRVSVFGQNTPEPGMLFSEENANGGSKAKAQYKPLKRWKNGECVTGRDVDERRH